MPTSSGYPNRGPVGPQARDLGEVTESGVNRCRHGIPVHQRAGRGGRQTMRKLRPRILVGGAVAVFAAATAFAVTSTADATTTAKTAALTTTAAKTGTTLSVTAGQSTIRARPEGHRQRHAARGRRPCLGQGGRPLPLQRPAAAVAANPGQADQQGRRRPRSPSIRTHPQYELAYHGNSTLGRHDKRRHDHHRSAVWGKAGDGAVRQRAPDSITSGPHQDRRHPRTRRQAAAAPARLPLPLRPQRQEVGQGRGGVDRPAGRGELRAGAVRHRRLHAGVPGGPVFTAARSGQATVTVPASRTTTGPRRVTADLTRSGRGHSQAELLFEGADAGNGRDYARRGAC